MPSATKESRPGAPASAVSAATKRVLLVHWDFNPPGGGTAVAAWTLQALRGHHRLELLTWMPPDLELVNRHYGTTLHPRDFVVHAPRIMARLTPRRRLGLWKHARLLRRVKRIGAHYDVIIGTNNEADFGRRGIQYVHFPRFYDPRINRHISRPLNPSAYRWYHLSPRIMAAYFRVCGMGTAFSMARMRENLTLVNSEWTGSYFKEAHGVDALTLYPPVASDFPDVPWAERELGFVCVGRIAPEKRIDMMVNILAGVRQRGHAVHLHIIGAPHHARYFEVVRRLQVQHAAWVSLEVDPPRHALTRLLATHRYGIHGTAREHFGIAVGEMVNAGCIVFVPADGGQVEIVGDNPHLTYETSDDAVNKIDAVLRDAARQDALRAHLASRRTRFSTAEFMRQMQSIVARFPA